MTQPLIVIEHRHLIELDPDTKAFFIDLVRPVLAGLNRLEQHMTEIGDFLATTDATVGQIQTALADVAAEDGSDTPPA